MRKMLKTFLFILFFCLPVFALANNFLFTKNLSIGSTGQDVLELQKVLNSDFDTKIAESGPGSIGNETNYFGNLTQNAVIKYQNKHSNDILIPAGLVSGTGFVGELTRKKLNNSVVGTSNNTNQSNLLQNNPFSGAQGANIVLVSKNVVTFDEELMIYLSAIDNDLEIYLDEEKIINAKNENGVILIEKFPKTKTGDSILTLRKENYKSQAFPIKIVSEKKKAPEILSLKENDTIVLGQEIILEGKNFSDNVKIISSFGIFNSTKISDNKITFKIELPAEFSGRTYNYVYSGYFRLQNDDDDTFSDPLLIKYSY
jgi:peptidoglycan hydrolase-like protein with peptidoglycan-binding domain